MSDSPTIAAFATPLGAAALAVLRVSGTNTLQIARKTFGIDNPVPRKANFGCYRDLSGKILDECLWIFFKGPSSYTGEDMLEIYCHGNPFIFKRILSDLFERGCLPAQPGEFTRRSFLNGKMDLTQAEAVANIITARSERSFEAARRLLSGELGRKISEWNNQILMLIAETETQIDFSDEDLPEIDNKYLKNKIKKLKNNLKETEDTARYSEKINEGISVVIFGAPNAGKSSLLNAIIGSERSIVSDEAGTTRDFISENITIGSHSIKIIDTAGIREQTTSKVEVQGILKTLDCMVKADFFIFVVDGSSPAPKLSDEFLKIIEKEKTLIVFNKNDLNEAFDKKQFFPEIESLSLSLLDKESPEFFKKHFESILEKKNIVPKEDILIVSVRHAKALKNAGDILEEIEDLIGSVPIEFISSKLRNVMEDLAEILGRFDNERVLDKVFSSFCIGK